MTSRGRRSPSSAAEAGGVTMRTANVSVPFRSVKSVASGADHREPQAEAPRVVPDGLLVLDLDADRGAGSDVGDRRGEDVRPLLLDEARAPAFVLRLLVLRLRRSPLLDDALDQPVAHLHAQMVDRRVLGQREDVDAFRPRA